MAQSHPAGNVSVGHATVSDRGFQIIGNFSGTVNYGPSQDDTTQRQWQAVLHWLSPSDEALRLQQFIHDESRRNRKLDDAGSWFIQSDQFTDWLGGRSKLTWVNGAMGCGKTVLFFLAVEKVREMCRQDKHMRLGYFYCTSRNPLGQDIIILLKSLIRQIAASNDNLTAIQSLYDACDQGLEHRSPTARELAACLAETMMAKSQPSGELDYYLLVDGLDELEASVFDELINDMSPLLSVEVSNIHLLVASRRQREIETSLNYAGSWISLVVDPSLVQCDIGSYVRSEMELHPRLRRLPQSTQDHILTRVVSQSDGMFRWAFLQVQSLKALKPPVTAQKVEDKLKSLPSTLDETYDRMLQGLDEFDKPTAMRALRWLVFSARQLYIEELADACAIDLDAANIMPQNLTPLTWGTSCKT